MIRPRMIAVFDKVNFEYEFTGGVALSFIILHKKSHVRPQNSSI